MPTTRLGRFLFYKQRQLRRRKRRERRANISHTKPATDRTRTCRRIDVSGETKQVGRTYPRHPYGDGWDATDWIAHGWTPPRPGRWGVLGLNDGMPPSLFDANHPRNVQVGYHHRRVLSIPRFRHLPRLPYRFTHDQLSPQHYYPYDVYQSGRPSYRSTLP